MFFDNQDENEKLKYENLLRIAGSLSRLFSDNDIPYLYYRMAENIFCKSFNAVNLSRSDISLDAKKDNMGVGLKTFLNKPLGSIEKIAEFNKSKYLIDRVRTLEEKINIISKLRNDRLITTSGIVNVDINDMCYHCVVRDKGKFLIHETSMPLINIDAIHINKESNNVVNFSDGIEEYQFNFSKSTLYKKFNVSTSIIYDFFVDILDDPYFILENISSIRNVDTETIYIEKPVIGTVYLPLYSNKKDETGRFVVFEHSGLNQWNANGRRRNVNEVYIPVPIFIHKKFPSFFPPRDISFSLMLPNGTSLVAKICQENGKALMSNPNSLLGEWLLRQVLHLEEGELLTYEKLLEIGIDTVEIIKYVDDTYAINFKKLGTFELFKAGLYDGSEE